MKFVLNYVELYDYRNQAGKKRKWSCAISINQYTLYQKLYSTVKWGETRGMHLSIFI
jgi:hypothetical protein